MLFHIPKWCGLFRYRKRFNTPTSEGEVQPGWVVGKSGQEEVYGSVLLEGPSSGSLIRVALIVLMSATPS